MVTGLLWTIEIEEGGKTLQRIFCAAPWLLSSFNCQTKQAIGKVRFMIINQPIYLVGLAYYECR